MVEEMGGQVVAAGPDHGRKLIAVVYADMAGYSRLIGLDDAGTFERLRELRHDLIDPALARHGGTLVNTGGDSLLITFGSIIPAVRFAVDMQRGVPDFDGDYAPDRRIRFRIGVNVGDVIPDGFNMHGDGVNIAARLQTVCPPGGICVSRIVRDHIGHRLGLGFKALGAIGFKNIARPTEAFLLELSESGTTSAKPRRRTALVVAAVIGVVSVVGGLEISGVHVTPKSPPPMAESSQAPTRLSIAVLPLGAPDGSAEIAQLADGVTEDLTTDLSQYFTGLVAPLENARRFKGQALNVQQAGQDLHVRYILTGNLRHVGAEVRTNVALVSGETGVTLWVDQLDATDQETIVGWLRNSVTRQLISLEAARSIRDHQTKPDSVDLILQARAAIQDPPSTARLTKAQALYEQALSLDPRSSIAMSGLALTILQRLTKFGEPITGAEIARAKELTAAAAAAAPASARVLWGRGYLLFAQQRWPEAEVAFEHALSRFSHFDAAAEMLGICKLQLGKAADAIPIFRRLLREDPRSPDIWGHYFLLGEALLFAGSYNEAIHWLQLSLAAGPEQSAINRSYAHTFMAAAYALSGDFSRARPEVVEASSLWPYLSARSFMAATVVNEASAAQITRVRDAIRLAGVRDHADENEDSRIEPTRQLRTETFGMTPLIVPGAATIRTPELATLLRDSGPLVIDASPGNRTLVGAMTLYEAGLGGSLQDTVQDRLRGLMAKLTSGDLSRPVVTLGINAERWTGYNLALRLVALGYVHVLWYRGGREAWDVAGLPMERVQVIELAAQ